MGDILNNINTASNGSPYGGSVSSDVQKSQVNQYPEMGAPVILKHSLDTSQTMSMSMIGNEGADTLHRK